MANETEQTLDETVSEQRADIARDISQVREWLKIQAADDIKNDCLSASQRATAQRIFNRVMHVGNEHEQATNQELDSYFNEAKVMREVVPVQVASVQRGIEDAARTICTIYIYKSLIEEGSGAALADGGDTASASQLQGAHSF